MLEFSQAGAAVGAASATLEKTRTLAAYFRTLTEEDLRRAAVYMSGRAFPPSRRRTLGLGWSTLSKVVSSVSRRDEAELRQIFRKHSDLGDWAGEALDGRTQPEVVTLQEVEVTLDAIRTARGTAKAAPLESMLRRMDPEAARFFIKIISGEMRIGLSEGLVEAAIAEAFGAPITQVKRVHLVTGDIGETAVRCKLGEFEASTITLFQPVRFMLASQVDAVLRRDVPVVLVIFDVLWLDGRTLLDEPLTTRRKLLEGLGLEHPFLLARLEEATDPQHLDRIFAETRERGNEGLMVKDPISPYTPGRRGLAWLKLKRPLATLDVVVTAVEWGHGKRKGVLSDYTFAVKDTRTGRLANVGKAYTGLTDAEIATFTKRFLAITVQDMGHTRLVRPEVVLEVAFDSIQHSGRHLSGYALRFPRIVRIRDDKPVDEIDTAERVAELYERYFGEKSEVPLSEVAET